MDLGWMGMRQDVHHRIQKMNLKAAISLSSFTHLAPEVAVVLGIVANLQI